jgi:HYDIN/CFA65/VesB-like, Ig-like domain
MSKRGWAGLGMMVLFGCTLIHACTPGFTPPDVGEETAEVRVDPETLDFGYVAVNNGKVEQIKIINDTGGEITLSRIAIAPELPEFQLVSAPDDGFVMDAGTDKKLNVEYYPGEIGESTTTVLIDTDHPDYPQLEVVIQGCSDPDGCGGGGDDDVGDDDDDDAGDDDAGDCGTIDISPDPVDFGLVEIGQTGVESVTIQNVGSAVLDIDDVQVSGAAFSHVGISTPAQIQAGGSKQFSVKFDPTTTGSASGTLTVDSCDAAQPQISVALQGAGEEACPTCQPDIDVSTTSIDYGDLTAGPAQETFTISNTGTDPLTLFAIQGATTFGGGTVSIVLGSPTAVIQAGATEYYTAEWVPGGGPQCLDGLDSGQSYLTIQSDDPDEPTVLIELSGCCDGSGQGLCTMVGFMNCMADIDCQDDPLELFACVLLGIPCF